MTTGILNIWFDDGREYGFIHLEKDGQTLRYFLHAKNIKSGVPKTGATVQFQAVETKKGGLAIGARILSAESGDGGAA